MAHFPDLAPYAYAHRSYPGVFHVGWLDNVHEYKKGNVPAALIAKIKMLTETPTELKRGFHVCELCVRPEKLKDESYWEWAKSRASNGEIRVAYDGISYAAPLLIAHYIEEHGYLPPFEFLKSVEEYAAEH